MLVRLTEDRDHANLIAQVLCCFGHLSKLQYFGEVSKRPMPMLAAKPLEDTIQAQMETMTHMNGLMLHWSRSRYTFREQSKPS